MINDDVASNLIKPRCPVFGECGGCAYQDRTYEDELHLKQQHILSLFAEFDLAAGVIKNIQASPKPYHYRNRLDLKLVRNRHDKLLLGFTPKTKRGLVEVDACPLAVEPVTDAIPKVLNHLKEHLPYRSRRGNIVIRCGDDGRVEWGGIGAGSLSMSEENYFSTTIHGRKIHYSLDAFFQVNLSILPVLADTLLALPVWQDSSQFYDLYGGGGLFSIMLADRVSSLVLIESNCDAVRLAEYNQKHLNLKSLQIHEGRVEACLPELIHESTAEHKVAMIDPPRAGLSDVSRNFLADGRCFSDLLYLSCQPKTLVRDLKRFCDKGWRIQQVQPFDFFPKTLHIETLVWLKAPQF